MRAVKGTLLIVDQAVKQLVLDYDEKERFIVSDLDDSHLLVSRESVEMVQEHLEAELEKNAWSVHS